MACHGINKCLCRTLQPETNAFLEEFSSEMKRIGLLVLALLLLFSPCYGREGVDTGIKFSDLYGEVSIRPNAEDDDAYEFAELDMTLYVDDRIRTKEESGAILSMADMSTFVIKPESIVILNTASGKENKIELLAGNIWVNVKKMVSDGTMEVEMSQAVAGIKGTNITCSTSTGEDRIQVLRGHAEVLIKETKEMIDVQEGEELVVKSGGKTEKVEIDVGAEQKKWDDATSRMGEQIQLNEIPEILRGILDAEGSEFARINEVFMKLIAQEKAEQADVLTVQRDAERFIGILMEDSLILSSTRKKVETALATPDLKPDQKVQFAAYMKNIAAVSARQASYQAEVNKIMRYKFKISTAVEDISSELEMLRTELAQSTAEVDAVRAVLSASPNGQTQDWFVESTQVCANALSSLDTLNSKISELLARNPTSIELQAMIKNINSQRNSIANMMRSLTVVEIPAATLTEMTQFDDVISTQMVVLQNEITQYNAIKDSNLRLNTAAMERRLIASVKIMDSYSKVRNQYTKAQRLYNNTMKATAGSKYRTVEQEEVETSWTNISDRFQQLGVVADELQSNIVDLENQLSTYLK